VIVDPENGFLRVRLFHALEGNFAHPSGCVNVIAAHKQLITQLLGQEWSTEPPKTEDPLTFMTQTLKDLLNSRKGYLHYSSDSTSITWPLCDGAIGTKTKANATPQLLSSVKKIISVRVYPYMNVRLARPLEEVGNKEHENTEEPRSSKKEDRQQQRMDHVQTVDLNLEKNGVKKNVAQLEFVGYPRLADSQNCDHMVIVDPENGFLRVRLFHALEGNFAHPSGCVNVIAAHKQMIECAQLQVESLRQSLTESLQLQSRSSVVSTNMNCSKATSVERQPLNTLSETDDGVVIHIVSSYSSNFLLNIVQCFRAIDLPALRFRRRPMRSRQPQSIPNRAPFPLL
jgi:hypothetical protein